MKCPICEADNPSDFTFCGYCGTPLTRRCPHCNIENSVAATVCKACGTNLAGRQASTARLRRDGTRQFAVVLFADIADFTQIAEGMDPEEVTWLVNRCLGEMANSIVQHGGRVAKYIGDGVMGIFEGPADRQTGTLQAVRAALRMRKNVANLRLSPQIPTINLHIGIACGFVVAAEFGNHQRKERAVIGSPVNLASCLEDVSAPNQILVSEDLHNLVSHTFDLQPLALPDHQNPETVTRAYELLE